MRRKQHAAWPKWLYKWDNGKRVGQIFDRPEDVKPGWIDADELGPKPDGSAKATASAAELPAKTESEKLSDDIDSLPIDRLREVATGAGIEVDNRWKEKTLIAKIKEAADLKEAANV